MVFISHFIPTYLLLSRIPTRQQLTRNMLHNKLPNMMKQCGTFVEERSLLRIHDHYFTSVVANMLPKKLVLISAAVARKIHLTKYILQNK